MAATPHLETRSPLTILNIVPKEHEKAIKQAFYNTAANIFCLLAFATAIAVYFILEAFIRPLLWAVLCGSFLYPFKRTLSGALRNWLNGLHSSETPIIVGLVVTPIKSIDNAVDYVCNSILLKVKLIAGVGIGSVVCYILWHFGPLWSIFSVLQGLFCFTYDLLGYFGSFWIWTLAVAYIVALTFFWNDSSCSTLRYLSIPVWVLMIFHVAASAGVLRVPLLILMGIGITLGFISEQKEVKREEEEGRDPNRKSVFESTMTWLIGESTPTTPGDQTEGQVEMHEAEESSSQAPEVETLGTPTISKLVKPDVVKPSSLGVHTGVPLRNKPRVKRGLSPVEPLMPVKSLSDQCFIGLLWALVLTRLWMHSWLVVLLLPLPMGLWFLKKLGLKLSSPEGPLGDKVKVIRRALATWIRDRKEVLMPKWLRGVARLVLKADQKFISILESSLDKTTSILFILLLLIGSTLFSVIFAIQVQQESMYLVKTTSNLLNNTLHPEMANWLPNNEEFQEAMDSMVGNAYIYGRNWIASKVRDMVNGPTDNNTQIEKQVLDMWDRLYESWLARRQLKEILTKAFPTSGWFAPANASSTSVVRRESSLMPFDMTNLTSIWDIVTQGDGMFNFGDIIGFVKENIGTFLSVLESIWLVLKGNMSLVVTVLTSTLGLVFGGGTALLNFVLSSVIFLTTLFYLLASSGDQYKPIEWFSAMNPTTSAAGGNTFGQAVQDAVGGVFMASLKMAAFYGLYTWLTHTLFGVNIVFIPCAVAAVFGAVPFVGTYLAAIPAVLELWLVQDRFILAMLLLVCHFLPTYVVDTAIYSEIKGGHPYMTGLAIAGGMYWIGLEGAIFGPIILCCLVVLFKVYSTMITPETPSYARSQSIL